MAREFFYPFLDEETLWEEDFIIQQEAYIDAVKFIKTLRSDDEIEREELVWDNNDEMKAHGRFLSSIYTGPTSQIYKMFNGDFIGQWLLISMGILPEETCLLLPSLLKMALEKGWKFPKISAGKALFHINEWISSWDEYISPDSKPFTISEMEQLFSNMHNVEKTNLKSILEEKKDIVKDNWIKFFLHTMIAALPSEEKSFISLATRTLYEKYLETPTDDMYRQIKFKVGFDGTWTTDEIRIFLKEKLYTSSPSPF